MKKIIDVILVVSMLLNFSVSTYAAEVKTVLSVSDTTLCDINEISYSDRNQGIFGTHTGKNIYVGASGVVWEDEDFEFYPVGTLGNGLVPVTIDGRKFGFADTKGNITVPLIYDEAKSYKNGFASVAQNGKFGVINMSGEYVIQPHYDETTVINEDLVRVKIGENYGVLSTTGEMILPCEYLSISGSCDLYGHIYVSKKGINGGMDTEGIINSKGDFVAPCKYWRIGDYDGFADGYVVVSTMNDDGIDEYGVIDVYGNEIIPCSEYNHFLSGNEGVLISNNKIIINLAKGITIETPYDIVYDICKDGIILVEQDGKYGLIDEYGNIVVECKYDQINRESNGVSRVCVNEKWGLINKNGIELMPCIYDKISQIGWNTEYIHIADNNKLGLINLNGKIITPCEHDLVYMYGDYVISVKNDKYALFDKNGNLLLPYEYDKIFVNIYDVNDEVEHFVVVKDSKLGIMNTDFEYVLPMEFGYTLPTDYDILSNVNKDEKNQYFTFGIALNTFFDGSILVEKDNKKGVVSLNGEVLIPCEYDKIVPYAYGSMALVANYKPGSNEVAEMGLLQYDGSERKDEYIAITMNRFPVITEELPVIENGRTLVPLRAVSEALGAAISWDNASQTAIATLDGVTVSVPVGSNVIYKNNSPITIDVPAKIMNSRTYVPIRAITEAFGCDVQWNNASKTVEITS